MSTAPAQHAQDQVSSILDGGDRYYDLKAFEYLLTFMEKTDLNSPTAYNFCYAMENYANAEGFPVGHKEKMPDGETDAPNRYQYSDKAKKGKVQKKDWEALKKYFKNEISSIEPQDAPTPILIENLKQLGDYLGFSQTEQKALEFLAVMGAHDYLENISGALCNKDASVGPIIARMCDDEQNHKIYSKFISPQGKLTSYGIMERIRHEYFPELSYDVADVLAHPDLNKSDIVEAFIGKPAETDLDPEDFSYMGDELDMICNIIDNAVKNGEVGINILIYGPAGGGKTELSRAISKRLGVSMYAIGESEGASQTKETIQYDDFGDPVSSQKTSGNQTTGQKRMADLLRSQSLLKGGKNAFLLFDEIEDLLLKGTDSEKAADTESKIAVNRMLENNPVPVIWNGNDPEKFHQAVRDRFTFSFYVDHPPVTVRRKIWEKQAKLQAVELSDDNLDYLSRKYDASPRKITLALKAGKTSGRGLQGIEIALPASARITEGSSTAILAQSTTGKFYNPELSNLKDKEGKAFPLPGLIQAGQNGRPFSLIAHGPKGSGLKSLTRHIAEKMDKNIFEPSMYGLIAPEPMGPSPEAKIMGAFNGAVDHRRFLAIHDLEALAGDPSNAKGWDTGLVDFIIETARNHNHPFAITANTANLQMPENLRSIFSDAVVLGAMDLSQRNQAFETFFGQRPPGLIEKLDGLVAADFANVRKDLLKRDTSKMGGLDVLHLLAKQIEIRSGEEQSGMGFGIGKKSSKIELPEPPKGYVMSIYPPIAETMPS